MQTQTRSIKQNWSTSQRCGAGRIQFANSKNRSTEGDDLNLVTNAIIQLLKPNKCIKATATHDSVLDDDIEKFNLKSPTLEGTTMHCDQKVIRVEKFLDLGWQGLGNTLGLNNMYEIAFK